MVDQSEATGSGDAARTGVRVAVVFEAGRAGAGVAADAAAVGVARRGGVPVMFGLPPLAAGGGDAAHAPGGGMTPSELREFDTCDAVIVTASPSFGRPTGEMTSFLDQAAAFVLAPLGTGRIAGIVATPGGQGGGWEFTLRALASNFLQLGLVVVGPSGAIEEARRVEMLRDVRERSSVATFLDDGADAETAIRAYLVGERVCAYANRLGRAVD